MTKRMTKKRLEKLPHLGHDVVIWAFLEEDHLHPTPVVAWWEPGEDRFVTYSGQCFDLKRVTGWAEIPAPSVGVEFVPPWG